MTDLATARLPEACSSLSFICLHIYNMHQIAINCIGVHCTTVPHTKMSVRRMLRIAEIALKEGD